MVPLLHFHTQNGKNSTRQVLSFYCEEFKIETCKDTSLISNCLFDSRMKKTPSAKFVSDCDLPPPTLSSGEGEEIPLDGKAAEAVGGAFAGGNPVGGTPVGGAAPPPPPAGPATSTPLVTQPKSLKTRLDQFLSPHPRFGRPGIIS